MTLYSVLGFFMKRMKFENFSEQAKCPAAAFQNIPRFSLALG
jgi:hypothetical protein